MLKNLLKNYGLTSQVTGSSDGVNYNIATTPLYFVRSGLFNNSGRLWYTGNNDYIWSKSATSRNWSGATVSSAYHLSVTATGINTSPGSNDRQYAFPLRCLARR